MLSRISLIWLLSFGLLAGPAVRGLRAEDHGLGRYIPAGMHFYGCWTASEDSDRFEKPFIDAFERLVDSGIGEDLFELATIQVDEDDRAEIRATIDKVLKLLGGPDWSVLLKTEVALAFRMAMPMPEYVFLFRVAEGSADAQQMELRKVLEGLSEFAPGVISVTTADREGVKVATLGSQDFPLAISVAGKGDVVALSTSDAVLDGVIRLMASDDASGSILKSKRFADSRRGLPKGTYGESCFDLAGYVGFLRGFLGMAQGFQPGDFETGILSIVGSVLDELSRMETVAVSERIEGRAYIVDGQVSLAPKNGGVGFIESLVAAQRPLDDYARVVPKDADSFYLASGVDPETIYDEIIESIKERIPGGEGIVQQFDAFQEAIGFHLKNDLLSWVDGGLGLITLPPRSGGEGGCLFFLRIKEDANEKARGFVDGILAHCEKYVESRGQKMDVVDVPGMEHFRKIRFAALPWCQPVVGTPSGVLVLASSADVVQRVGATFRGDEPNIKENPRFAKIGVPDGPLVEVYYADIEDSLEFYANAIGTLGFAASLVPEERDTRPVIKVGSILTKLAAFLRDIDLVVDYGGYTLYDSENHFIRGRQVVTFREARSREF